MTADRRAIPVIVRASPVALSRATRRIGWLAFPWFFGILFGGAALQDRLGWPLGMAPLPVRLALISVAAVPMVMYVASPWLGRLPAMRWLLASPQPEARLDLDGLALTLPEREPIRLEWSAITGMQPANDFRRSTHLLGTGGEVLATLPAELAYPRGHGWGWSARSLGQEVVALRSDRYELTGTNWAGWPDRLGLRDTGRPVPTGGDSTRRRQAIGFTIILALLGAFGIVIALVWLTTGAAAE